MSENPRRIPEKLKAFAYITRGRELLVFRHPQHPEVGLQVPGGTVTPGEDPAAAAAREAEEESGLQGLRLVAALGEQRHHMAPIKDEIHLRHFYHFECARPVLDKWTHFERHPDGDGSEPPIELEFHWQRLDDTDAGLVTAQGALLPRISGSGSARNRPVHRRSFVADIAVEITRARNERKGALTAALDALSGGSVSQARWVGDGPAAYAALHHLFYIMLKLANTRNRNEAAVTLERWNEHAAAYLSGEAPLLLTSDSYRIHADPAFDSPLCIFEAGAPPLADGPARRQIRSAQKLLRQLGYSELLDGYLGIVALMTERSRTDATRSFTVSALPGTIFIDHVDDEVRLAELLLHEGSHSWLNDALMALGESVSREVMFWSPWKQTMRPAYGILQAAFAFSQMMQFFADMLEDPALSDHARLYCTQRLKADGAALWQGLPQVREVAGMVLNPLLRGLVLDECNRALQHDLVKPLDPTRAGAGAETLA